MQYAELTRVQMLDVLRETGVTYLALAEDAQPYIVPMYFLLDATGSTPVIRLLTGSDTRQAAMLRENGQVCLAFSRMGCAWIDSVTALGSAAVCERAGKAEIAVRVRALSGRRFFLD